MIKRTAYLLWHLYLVCLFFVRATVICLLNHNKVERRKKLVHNTSYIGKLFMRALRIDAKVLNPGVLKQMQDKNYLAVANHVSYTDIIILASLEDFVFITSVEMGNNPFLGSITRKGGCLYTDRKKFVSLPKEIEKFAETIKAGFKVMLFPEGTSTNGETVKEFRKSLFQVPFLAQCPVLPICIRYKTLDGKAIDEHNRDLLYWYGDMDFAPHFMKLIGRRIGVEIEVLDPIYSLEGKTRQTLSNDVYTQISSSFHQTRV